MTVNQVTTVAVEALATGSPALQVTAIAVEVLTTSAAGASPTPGKFHVPPTLRNRVAVRAASM